MIPSLAVTLVSIGFFLLCGAALLSALGTTWFTMQNYRLHTQLAEERLRILAALNELNRWCSHDFPLVEDLTCWLHAHITQDADALDIHTFTEQLRQKYPRPEKDHTALQE